MKVMMKGVREANCSAQQLLGPFIIIIIIIHEFQSDTSPEELQGR